MTDRHPMTDYIPGFGNHVSTEAVPGALPIGRNSPSASMKTRVLMSALAA